VIAMTANFKDYLGAIEVKLEGVLYEIGLREEGPCALRGIWTCIACGATDITSELKAKTTEAIDLARSELLTHHEEVHCKK
jgi:hypothetical protein